MRLAHGIGVETAGVCLRKRFSVQSLHLAHRGQLCAHMQVDPVARAAAATEAKLAAEAAESIRALVSKAGAGKVPPARLSPPGSDLRRRFMEWKARPSRDAGGVKQHLWDPITLRRGPLGTYAQWRARWAPARFPPHTPRRPAATCGAASRSGRRARAEMSRDAGGSSSISGTLSPCGGDRWGHLRAGEQGGRRQGPPRTHLAARQRPAAPLHGVEGAPVQR